MRWSWCMPPRPQAPAIAPLQLTPLRYLGTEEKLLSSQIINDSMSLVLDSLYFGSIDLLHQRHLKSIERRLGIKIHVFACRTTQRECVRDLVRLRLQSRSSHLTQSSIYTLRGAIHWQPTPPILRSGVHLQPRCKFQQSHPRATRGHNARSSATRL